MQRWWPGITEFTLDYFVQTAGLHLQKVPYRDIVQAATDVGEGRIQIFMGSYAVLRLQPSHHEDGIREFRLSDRVVEQQSIE